MTNELATLPKVASGYNGGPALRPAALTLSETMSLGKVLAASGYFADARAEAQAVVKVLYGQEFGIQPVSAMMGVHIINGKPALSANLMAAIIKGSNRYDFRVKFLDAGGRCTGCSITFYERGEEIGVSSFTADDAKAAALLDKDIWRKFFRNMAYARAMSNGARWYCPDLFGGAPVYTPEEMGAVVDGETGEVLSVPKASETAADEPPAPSHAHSLVPAPEPAIDAKAGESNEDRKAALRLLLNTEGFIPAYTDKPACLAFIGNLLGHGVPSFNTVTAEELTAARVELEQRNQQRKRFFALATKANGGPVDDEECRKMLAVILEKPVPTRTALTAADWTFAAEMLENAGTAQPDPATVPNEDDPFASE